MFENTVDAIATVSVTRVMIGVIAGSLLMAVCVIATIY